MVIRKVDVLRIMRQCMEDVLLIDDRPKDEGKIDIRLRRNSDEDRFVQLRTRLVEAFELTFDNGFSLTLYEHEPQSHADLLLEICEIVASYLSGSAEVSEGRFRMGFSRRVMTIETSAHTYTMHKGGLSGTWEVEI